MVTEVDCTNEKDICTTEEVPGFPTARLYYFGAQVANY